MSISVNLETLAEQDRKKIVKDLTFCLVDQHKEILGFSVDTTNTVKLPFYYAQKNFALERKTRDDFLKIPFKFRGKLREEQKIVRKEVIQNLRQYGCSIMGLYTGFGKSITSTNIATKIGLQTLILASRIVLFPQWEKTVRTFTNQDIVILKPKMKKADIPLAKKAGFLIANPLNIPKIDPDLLKNVGTLIVDEVHLLGTEKMSKSFYSLSPRYVLGLSATPNRPDGMDKLLFTFFGNNIIFRKLNRYHEVYRIGSGIQYTVNRTRQGTVDWNSILTDQALHDQRNNMIAKLVTLFPKRTYLILCKRICQAEAIHQLLDNYEINTSLLVGSKQTYDENAQVLIATVQKAGIGFDHPKLDTLIVASDLKEYFIQYLGRIMRTNLHVPMIFDIVDNFSVLQSHYLERKKIYIDHGGKVELFQKKYKNEWKILKDILNDK